MKCRVLRRGRAGTGPPPPTWPTRVDLIRKNISYRICILSYTYLIVYVSYRIRILSYTYLIVYVSYRIVYVQISGSSSLPDNKGGRVRETEERGQQLLQFS